MFLTQTSAPVALYSVPQEAEQKWAKTSSGVSAELPIS